MCICSAWLRLCLLKCGYFALKGHSLSPKFVSTYSLHTITSKMHEGISRCYLKDTKKPHEKPLKNKSNKTSKPQNEN